MENVCDRMLELDHLRTHSHLLHVHKHTHTYTHTHTHTHILTHTHTHTRTHTGTSWRMCVTACLRLTTCSRIHTCSTYTNTHTNTHIRTHTHFNTHTHRYFMENVCDRMLELDRGRCFMHKFGGPGSYDLFKEVRLANYYALCNPTHVYLLF